ncbi:hypothetical protein SAMD00024442_27_3 [Candidatus Symbiothrix dinenymphae]|nr:hypothetical protein SAMD00024442_27_3 [Candidatus Symbiothrix dinenymphae]
MNNFRKMAILLLIAVAGFYACEEGERFGISSDDGIPPAPPVLDSVHRLNGGAELFYKIPIDEDVISIEGSYIAQNGEVITAAASFYAKSLTVRGMADTLEHVISLYSVDRAGNKSEAVPVPIKPLEPTIVKVAKTFKVKPAFSALIFDWENELKEDINIYIDLSYLYQGSIQTAHHAISSKKPSGRQFIKDLDLPETEAISVSFSIADAYGNQSQVYDLGQNYVKRDSMLDKSKMSFFAPGYKLGKDTTGAAVYMANGNVLEGRINKLLDGIIENDGYRVVSNICNFNGAHNMTLDGATRNVNAVPWSIFIDLGDYYELSRIITHQRASNNSATNSVLDLAGLYADNPGMDWNIGRYKVFWLDETTDTWKLINETTIPKPPAEWSNLEKILYAAKGDEAFMYPDEPDFTPRTRYFRYQALNSFGNNYANVQVWCMSEITLYGRKAQ